MARPSRWRRRVAVPDDVLAQAPLVRGEKVLAGAQDESGAWLLGTRDALLVPTGTGTERIPWEQLERADWDREESRLRVARIGDYGRPRPAYTFTVAEPGLFLDLLRERVTASMVLQRWVPIRGKSGLSVVARRAPRGTGDLQWMYEFDAGIDPDEPAVRDAAEGALQTAAADLGVSPDAATRADPRI